MASEKFGHVIGVGSGVPPKDYGGEDDDDDDNNDGDDDGNVL